jgi:YVTN family beta-propeller protein
VNTNTIISSVIFIALLLSIATIPPINSLSVYQVKAEDQNSINELHRTQKSSTTSVAVNSLTNMIYSTTDSGVYVIDGKTNELIEKITIASNGAIPSGLAVNPMTNTIYVTDRDYNAVYVIDGKTHNVTKTIELHDSPIDIAINSVTNRIYVSAESALFVIDGVANEIIHRYKYIKIAKHLAGVAINPDKNIVYVTDSATSLYVLDGTTNQLTKNITIGKSPADIAVNTNTNKVYVVLGDSNRLSVVDGNTNSIVKTIVSGNTSSSSNSAAVSVNTNTNKVYVTDPGS